MAPSGALKKNLTGWDMQKYYLLDGIRGIAAIFIVLRHTPGMWGGASFVESYLAVDLFFVLSGLVIAKSYEGKLADRQLSLSDFLKKRVIRLYPVYFVGAAVITAIFALVPELGKAGAGRSLATLDYVFAFLMLPNFSTGQLFPVNGPAWSLFFELLVNGVFGLTFALKRGRQWCEFLLVAASGMLLVVYAFFYGDLSRGYAWEGVQVGLVRAMYSFYMGVFAFRLSRTSTAKPQVNSFLVLLVIGAVLAFPVPESARKYYDCIVVLFVFPALTYVASFSISTSLETKIFSFLGLISYPIYILHFPLYLVFAAFTGQLWSYAPAGTPAIGFMYLFMASATILSLVRRYDVPVRQWAESVFISRTPPSSIPPSHGTLK
jgi:peptidoglycan/LPS O-acetylase OafA/YrhL